MKNNFGDNEEIQFFWHVCGKREHGATWRKTFKVVIVVNMLTFSKKKCNFFAIVTLASNLAGNFYI